MAKVREPVYVALNIWKGVRVLMGAQYALLFCVLLYSAYFWPYCLAATPFILSLIYRDWRHHVSHAADSAVVALLWRSDGVWRLRRADGSVVNARLLSGGWVQPFCLVLPFRTDDGRCSVILFRQAVNELAFTRLFIRLRADYF